MQAEMKKNVHVTPHAVFIEGGCRIANMLHLPSPHNPWAAPRCEINYSTALIVWRPG